MTDSRKSRAYEAEQLVRRLFDSVEQGENRTITWCGSTLTLPVERKFASVECVQSYVDRVLALNWLRERYPRARISVRVRARKGNSHAHYEPWGPTIAVPVHVRNKAWALREIVILHEIAHHLSYRGDHGPEFCEAFTYLVSEIVGPEAGFILSTALHENGAI